MRLRTSPFLVPRKKKCKKNVKRVIGDECSITGIIRIADTRKSVWVRWFWGLLMLTCFAISLELARERIYYYLSEPILANTETKTNKSLTFPVVTICNRCCVGNVFGNDTLNFCNDNFQQTIIKCSIERNKNCSQVGFWRPVSTVLGVCHQFEHVHDVNISGPYHGLYIELENQKYGIKVFVHDRSDTPQIDVELKGLFAKNNNFVDLIITIKQVLRKRTKHFPCEENPDFSFSHCVARCWTEHIETLINCSLPRIDVPAKLMQKEICSISNKDQVRRIIQDEMESGNWKPSSCYRCMSSCKIRSYEVRSQFYMTKYNHTTVRIYYNDMSYETVRESPAYSLMALACDIGGNFGFCLGISIPTIVELVELLIVSIQRRAVSKWQ